MYLEGAVPDLLRDGSDWLTDQLKASASTSVTYVRGASTATIQATIGRSVFEAQHEGGVIEQFESRDFVVKASDLPYGEPQRGDKIRETSGGTTYVYEVATPRGVPLFHYADAFQTAAKIHTKRIQTI